MFFSPHIPCGLRLFGPVDHICGTCYVATRFIHIHRVPLIPISSWIVIDDSVTEVKFRGRKISLSIKSILVAWMLTALVLIGAINSVWGLAVVVDPRGADRLTSGVLRLLLGLTCLGVWWLYQYRPLRASNARAEELLELLDDESLFSKHFLY